ncbi:hypothetical protein Shyd_87910 [Streptomyces hydrogenans]|uniref:Secreted protein n=1 Tax=Streptomyces hydrogenans TaxID=1873719 RepID=A0ABQ3PQW7_9ACTN|nr:hypothetical protein GCM10018784_08190 [Streptomyces hydrogenans]GHI27420.1 hypothetical protein Shyd_87910 [Streptomyces hydrogenans]
MLMPARAAMSDIRRAAVPFSAMTLMAARMARSRASSPLGWRFLSIGTRAAGREAVPPVPPPAASVTPSDGAGRRWGSEGPVSDVGMSSHFPVRKFRCPV